MAKKKLERFAEMEELPNVFQPKHIEIFRTDYKLKGKWNSEIFHNSHPIVLEIGCGKGEYTVELSKLYPEKNFIGLDIKGARMWKGAKEAMDTGMKNVLFLRMYAEMLESIFAPGEISEIWITFPDPQMTRTRKRLTGTRFLSLYQKILSPDAIVHLKTDSPFLYSYTSALIKENHLTEWVNTEDLYGCGMEDEILGIKTFYEKQWLSRGKKIKYIRFSLTSDHLLTEPEIEIERDNYHSAARYMGNTNALLQ
ncbi:MAG: tRNA (guanosine(46)-N7)-methyltransferase TrmB [Odoribacter sp.]